MSYCINPNCPQPKNPDKQLFCQACGFELLVEGLYRVVKVLGYGGFAITYEVNDQRTPKVLKVLNLAKFPHREAKQKALSLFEQEARVLTQLNYPGIPKVEKSPYFTIQIENSQEHLHCLVMEKIEGVNLEQWLKQRGRPISEQLAIQWLKQLIAIVREVHRTQFFHRDIKPTNIMLQPSGNLALIDFGSVRAVTHTYLAKMGAGQFGTAIISKGYAPPEQENGRTVPQSDFFALGRTFVYLLTGQHPLNFYDAYTDELRWRSGVPHLSPALADLIDRLIAHLPGQRPANTEVILQQLADLERGGQGIGGQGGGGAVPDGAAIAGAPHPLNFVADKTLSGHQDGIWAVAISPSGHILVSASWDKKIKVWNLATGQLLRTLSGHTDAVWSLAISEDGKTLVSGSSDNTLKIWNVPTGKLIRTLIGHSYWVAAVAIAPDGETLVSGSSDKTIKLWNLTSGTLIRTLNAHSYPVTSVRITSDGKTLVSGSGDKTIKRWNLVTGELQSTLTGHSTSVTCLAISPDGKTLVSGDLERFIKVWDLETGQVKNTLTGHSGTVWTVAIAPDGQTLVSGSRDKTIKIWDLTEGELLATLTGHRGAINDIAIHADGQILVSGSNDQNMKIWYRCGSEERSASPMIS